jgi:hypothetical protein
MESETTDATISSESATCLPNSTPECAAADDGLTPYRSVSLDWGRIRFVYPMDVAAPQVVGAVEADFDVRELEVFYLDE